MLHSFVSWNAKESDDWLIFESIVVLYVINSTDERERGKNGAENIRITMNGRNAGLPFWNCAKNSYVDRVAEPPADTWHSFNVQFRIYHSFDHIDAFMMTVSVRLSHSHWRPIATAAQTRLDECS